MSQELKLRIISAIVLAIVVLGATWMGGATFRIVCAVIGLLIYSEWSTITGLPSRVVSGNAFGWFALAVIAGNTTRYGYATTIQGIEEAARATGHMVTITVVESDDPRQVTAAVDHFHSAMGELQKATIEHVFAMRAVLTPEQAARFDRTVVDALTADPR